MKIEIKHRHTAAVLYTTDVEGSDEHPIRTALERAVIAGLPADVLRARLRDLEENFTDRIDDEITEAERVLIQRRIEDVKREIETPSADAYLARADLAGADLARAYLEDADLARAYLEGANLAGADLAGADLAGAYLEGADLARAYLEDADLARAYLEGANLAGADLARADLARAYLEGADLARAYLEDAYLAGADLAGAYLAGADLADADLAGADLARAYLEDAYLAGADLADANLAGADLAGADLAGAYLEDAKNLPPGIAAVDPPTPYVSPIRPDGTRLGREELLARRAERVRLFREAHPDVPVVENIDVKVRDWISAHPKQFDMGTWCEPGEHECETTYCRAGIAVVLAGEAGLALRDKYAAQRGSEGDGWQFAARDIYRASTGRVPHFFATTERAKQDIERCAAEQIAATQSGEVP